MEKEHRRYPDRAQDRIADILATRLKIPHAFRILFADSASFALGGGS